MQLWRTQNSRLQLAICWSVCEARGAVCLLGTLNLFCRFVNEIQKRREEGIARRSEAAARQRSRASGDVAVGLPAQPGTRIFARVTYWAVLGAFGAVAFAAVLRNSARLDWLWGTDWWPV
jgi:hypothetical protein